MIYYKYNECFNDVELMTKHHYETDENEDDVLVLGWNVKQPVHVLRQMFPNKRIIIYQLEQLVVGNHWSTEHIVGTIRGADEIWDYDMNNIGLLKQYGIEAKFKPVLYTEELKHIDNSENPDIDVLFYGLLSPRRADFFQILQNAQYFNVNMMLIHGIAGEKLDEYISRSKIILNLHSYAAHRQEQVRMFYPVINNKCVISESSEFNYFGNSIVEVPMTSLIFTISQYIQYGWWKAQGESAAENFKKLSNNFKNVIY